MTILECMEAAMFNNFELEGKVASLLETEKRDHSMLGRDVDKPLKCYWWY